MMPISPLAEIGARCAVTIRSGAALLLATLAMAAPASADFDTRAEAAIVVDMTTGTTLLEKNADVPLPPASMSKLMTLNMLFEAIEDGRVSLDETFSVSPRARQMGGSKMFLDERDRPTAEDLIRGIAVLSGNDATVVVAEGLAGTEETFARRATERARALGMEQTTIANASGWPDPEHRMSMRDLTILAQRLITEFPQYYDVLSEPEATWNNITQENRLPLLGDGLGMDGLKTGFTSEAGYSLTGSARQGDRRIVFAFSGLDSSSARIEEAERIINWAFRQFVMRDVVQAGARVASADVWLGEADSVALSVAEDLHLLLPATVQEELSARVEYEGPVEAPISAGQQIGQLVIEVPEMETVRVPLVADHAVARGGFGVRLRAAATLLMRQLRDEAAGF